jgi:hypothetical protein
VNSLRKVIVLLILLALVLVVVLRVYRAWSARAIARADRALVVPVIVSPSIQPVKGQTLLFKASNISEAPVGMRIMLFNDRESLPAEIKDFPKIAPGTTVTYVHKPPQGMLAIDETTYEVPDAVRAVLAPLPGGDQGAIRNVVASLQIMRVQPPSANAASPSLEAPILVPLERCRFEPKGFVPYTGGRWVWNCAPAMQDVP